MKETVRQLDYGPTNRLCLLWAGVVIGCTFIATPIKFQAPDISLPVALEVGRLTFHAVGIAELVFAALVLATLVWRKTINWLCFLAITILAAEWFLIMPALDGQTLAEIHGQIGGSGQLHVIFAGLEVVKLILLLWVGFQRSWKGQSRQADPKRSAGAGRTEPNPCSEEAIFHSVASPDNP